MAPKRKAAPAPAVDKTPAEIFYETGAALYDNAEDWAARLAEAMGIARETARNIRRGNMRIGADHGIFATLESLAERRAAEVVKARDALKAWRAVNMAAPAATEAAGASEAGPATPAAKPKKTNPRRS